MSDGPTRSLEPGHPDWQEIGRDCAHPEDLAAYERLRQLREDVIRARLEEPGI